MAIDNGDSLDDRPDERLPDLDAALAGTGPPTQPQPTPVPPGVPNPTEVLDILTRTAPGRLGRFFILRELGRGGCGIVFLAFDPVLGRKVAIKVPRPETLINPEARHRFIREARIAAEFDHPNLIPVHEVVEEPVFYIISAYSPGITLRAWLDGRPGPVPVRTAAALVAALAGAVDYIHARSVWHRDIKPGNILLETGRTPAAADDLGLIPRLTDFGLAKVEASDTQHTRTGTVMGTAQYMAPEQANSQLGKVGPHTDVYGLGVLLYEVLTGQTPFRGTTDLDTLRQLLADEPVRPRRLRADLPRDLETICLKCLEKEPQRRYASAADLAEDLRLFLEGKPIRERPPGWAGKAVKWARRRPGVAALLAVSAALLLALIGGAVWYSVQVQEANEDLQAALQSARKNAREAGEQKRRADQRDLLARQRKYVLEIPVAARAQDRGQRLRALTILNHHRPLPDQVDVRGFEWYYLRGLGYRACTSWRGHRDQVWGVAVSPDGKMVASAGTDWSVKVWDLATGQVLWTGEGHRGPVDSVAFSPNGRLLASSGNVQHTSGQVLLWKVATGKCLAKYPVPEGVARCVAFTPGGKQLVASCGNVVRFWDTRTPKQPKEIGTIRVEHAIWAMALAPNGRTIAIGQDEGTVCFFRLAPGAGKKVVQGKVRKVRAHKWVIKSMAFTPDGKTLVTGSWDRTVKLWDVATRRVVATLRPHRHEVWGVAAAPDNRTLAVAASCCGNMQLPVQIVFWDVTGRRLGTVQDSDIRGVLSLAFCGRRLVLGCQDHSVRVLDYRQDSRRLSLRGHGKQEAWSVAFSPNSRTLASAGDDRLIKLWNPRTGKKKMTLRGHRSLVSCVAFAPGGRLLASGSYDKTVKIWDLPRRRVRWTLEGHTDRVRCLAFSPDGRSLASGDKHHQVKLWDVATGTLHHTLVGHQDGVRGLAFTPNGKVLVSTGEDRTVRLWDVATGELIKVLSDEAEVGCVAISPSGKTLATGNKHGVIKLWDRATGRLLVAFTGHTEAVHSVAFSPKGKTLVSGSKDKLVRLWDPVTGQALLTLRGHPQRVNSVAFAPDGTALASACHDGRVRLCQAARARN
jgi:WD40 repeat protein